MEELSLTLSLISPSGVTGASTHRSGQQETRRDQSDEDDGGGGGKKKLRLSEQQASTLEDAFKQRHMLNPNEKLALAEELNLTPRQVEVWFQNRRARKRLKKTEVDCQMLKRCCERLGEENRRLQKEVLELRELRALKPPPAATILTICPSCERATAAAVSFPPICTTHRPQIN